jgi:hypothetical protein
LLSPPGAVFQVLPATPFPSSPQPPRQLGKRARADLKKLAVHCPAADTLNITVLLSPGGQALQKPALMPLNQWN